MKDAKPHTVDSLIEYLQFIRKDMVESSSDSCDLVIAVRDPVYPMIARTLLMDDTRITEQTLLLGNNKKRNILLFCLEEEDTTSY